MTAVPTSMYQETIKLLANAKGRLRKISEESQLDYNWLTQVASQRIKDPGVKKIEKLYAHLTSTKP